MPLLCLFVFILQHSYISGNGTIPQTSIGSNLTDANASSDIANSSATSLQTGLKAKKKQWRTLKQILTMEQSLPWPSAGAKGEKVIVNAELVSFYLEVSGDPNIEVRLLY